MRSTSWKECNYSLRSPRMNSLSLRIVGAVEFGDTGELVWFLSSVYNMSGRYSVQRPFLPFKRSGDGTLVFPTGKFVGVYFSEELKFAEEHGYLVVPLRGWQFDRMKSPFYDFVHDLYQRRLEAKEKGDKAIVCLALQQSNQNQVLKAVETLLFLVA